MDSEEKNEERTPKLQCDLDAKSLVLQEQIATSNRRLKANTKQDVTNSWIVSAQVPSFAQCFEDNAALTRN